MTPLKICRIMRWFSSNLAAETILPSHDGYMVGHRKSVEINRLKPARCPYQSTCQGLRCPEYPLIIQIHGRLCWGPASNHRTSSKQASSLGLNLLAQPNVSRRWPQQRCSKARSALFGGRMWRMFLTVTTGGAGDSGFIFGGPSERLGVIQ